MKALKYYLAALGLMVLTAATLTAVTALTLWTMK